MDNSGKQSHTDISETLSKDQQIPLTQTHEDQREPLQEPEPHAGALNPQMVDITGLCVLSLAIMHSLTG